MTPVPTDFDEDVPTDPEAGALPEVADPDDDDTTTRTAARCARCLRLLKVGGDAARPTFEEMAENAPEACWRSLSGAWWWCSGRKPWTLTLTG